MLRYKTQTIPGLDALYDIQPGNRAGLFLQSQCPHGVARLESLGIEVQVAEVHGRDG